MLDISLTVSPLKDAEGKVIGASKIARDITERRRAQERQQLLINEIQHRIKNTLATVQAIATQTLRNSPDEREAFVARLHALAGAHDLLTDDNWHQAALNDLVGKALNAFQDKHREHFLIDGPDGIFLDAQKSSLLVMALHELATNAMKYGALSNEKGQVRVGWETLGDDPAKRFRLYWTRERRPAGETHPNKKASVRFLSSALCKIRWGKRGWISTRRVSGLFDRNFALEVSAGGNPNASLALTA